MGFIETTHPPQIQGRLGPATVTILGAKGLRLTKLNSFHLDEGPDFSWLNVYRTLADGKQLEVVRDRTPDVFCVSGGDAEVRWGASGDFQGEVDVRYRLDEAAASVDVQFSARLFAACSRFEMFISSYFTPYYTPRYAVADTRLFPEKLFWYEKKWFAEGENETWTRDTQVETVFRDGRWATGFPVNWRVGPHYAFPLMIQEHRYGHAILLMARREDCIGISGLNSYHNSQYFHLFGRDIAAGEKVSADVRMTLVTRWEDLQQEALARYEQWVGV
ncbi:MAG: hypothetical protein FJY97_00460 [candidate division Zixibacteria bacterium]|nr:hypothetical protein [candidate division Zixibacteria bacterium]